MNGDNARGGAPSLRKAREASAAGINERWGSLTWLAGSGIGNSSRLTVGRVVIEPGMSNPRHRHDTCEEVLYLLTGKLGHAVGDRTVVVEPGDTLVVPRGVAHSALNVSGVPAQMIVVYDTGTRDFVKE